MKYFIYGENSILITINHKINDELILFISSIKNKIDKDLKDYLVEVVQSINCLLYTSPSPRDGLLSRMPSSA